MLGGGGVVEGGGYAEKGGWCCADVINSRTGLVSRVFEELTPTQALVVLPV